MRKLLYFAIRLLLCICLFCSCNTIDSTDNASVVLSGTSKVSVRSTKPLSINYREGYPGIIESLNLQELHDSTKWYLYVRYCTVTPKYMINDENVLSPPITYASMALMLDTVIVRNDSTEFFFEFYLNDTIVVSPLTYKGMYPYVNGLMYSSTSNDSLNYCYLYKYGALEKECMGSISRLSYDTTTMREFKPLQLDVIAYINENKNILHPWFYKEAVRRGVIKD